MKIIITENKWLNYIEKELEETFNEDDELDWTYAEDLNGNEDKNLIIFYRGDWEGEDYSDIVFAYYAKDYFDNSPANSHNRSQAPMLMVTKYYDLNDMFAQHWIEPMKKWFEDKFNLPVKTITSY
jgi:hypothetical protein